LKIVIKVGGSLSIDDNGPRFSYFSRLLPVLKRIDRENQLIVSIGGGRFVRNYFKKLKKFRLSDEELEWLSVELLRVNVKFLATMLKKRPIYSLGELNKNSEGVIGGIMPGRSTDANAAQAAAAIKADYFIKLTDVDGVYTKDPDKFKDAKKLDCIKFNDFRKYGTEGKPGSYGIMDMKAIGIITKNKIKTVVMDGRNPKDILKLLKGEKIGTIIAG
jgi:uridylate kinase